MKKILLSTCFLLYVCALMAQPSQKLYTVVVQPDKSDWTYKVGEEAEFTIYVMHNMVPMSNVTLNCQYGPETMPPLKSMSLNVKDKSVKIKVPGMKVPGFQTIRASVEIGGETYMGYANVGYDPDKIEPTQVMPNDFQQFWDKAKAEAEQIPLEPLLTLQPELCTPEVNVYHVRFQNNAYGSYIYGMLSMPSKPGKYPAILQVPGSGVHKFTSNPNLAKRGVIFLEIGIHGIPVNLPQQLYTDLANTALRGYARYNMEDKDSYYYKRVYIGCKRSIDFIYTLDGFDGANVGVMGGSQGGSLAIVTAALDPRIKCMASRHPGACDMTGGLHGRPAGSPAVKKGATVALQAETSKYYDVVNFARIIKVPGYYTWGYNDTACPPTTTFSAFNVVTAPKTLRVFQETAHWHFPEQNELFENWVLNTLGVK